MNEARLRQIQELFDRAVARPVEERPRFLADQSAGDAELRAEVESLLAHLEVAADAFMRSPDSGTAALEVALHDAAAQPDPLVGRRIGRYQVQRLIAAGGMGAVYEAVQDQPHRTVALKVLHRGVASPSAMRRFQDESQILGRLRHPNIAQVYEAGIHEDREGILGPAGGAHSAPYFAMEFIPNARTITEYASEQKLGVHEKLLLFAQVCDAVHHGHQRGIIHRDLKPANILVADDVGAVSDRDSRVSPLPSRSETSPTAQLKVIDFGIARCTDADIAATAHTQTGQLVGTLAYMSPEQCRADPQDIDIRSDVYSLGVVLYELLCERLPYEVSRTNVVDAARTICEQPPERPSALARRLRGDLETIALKALEKDRSRRYPSADALGQDVRRYLAGEPIQARRPTTWTHLVRWTLRHPAITTTAACLGIAAAVLVGTALGISWTKRRPYRLDWADDASAASLVSYRGDILHTWPTGHVGNLPPARWRHLFVQPNKLGGRRLAIVGFGYHSSGPHAGSLCVFDVDDGLATPLWTVAVESDEIPSSLDFEKYYGTPQVGDWAVIDIFPESPGEEIVASHIIGTGRLGASAFMMRPAGCCTRFGTTAAWGIFIGCPMPGCWFAAAPTARLSGAVEGIRRWSLIHVWCLPFDPGSISFPGSLSRRHG
jgi:serine/threonine protein kinase